MPAIQTAKNFPLLDQIREIGRQARVSALAVALYDYAFDLRFSVQASRVFHAASTIKLAVLFALYRASETGRLRLNDRLHVRNRFRSQAGGAAFFLQADRDGDPDLYKRIGRTATLQELAETMIVRSSNLATNLLIDHLEVSFITEMLAAAGLDGLRCVRGVEDEEAFARGLNNFVTADGLLEFLRCIHESRALGTENRDRLFDVLFQQRFNTMLPAGVPDAAKARIAHKTGEISTVAHDAGMVFIPNRAPYALVVLTEYPASGTASARHKTVAAVSAAVYEFLQAANTPATP